MPFLNLLAICISLVVGAAGIASIFVNGWVKATHISELKTDTERAIKVLADYAEKQFVCQREDINKLWEKISQIDVLSSKIEDVKGGIDRLEKMLVNNVEKRANQRDS
jgi:hypothetical protein